MAGRRVLVMGASGFVGSHVTRAFVEDGDDVRVFLRRTSRTDGIDDLDVERHHGDLTDADAVRAAMTGCDVVCYCVVDTRFTLRDPAPLFATNVDALRHVLDVAVTMGLSRFVFCSTIGTIALAPPGRRATEDMPVDWAGGAYIASRRRAEDMVLRYAAERGLPAVALCVSTPYGPLDFQPHQGLLIRAAARGRMPVYVRGVSAEVVGISDVARAFVLAAERGRPGERYIVSESYLSMRDLLAIAAGEVGARPPRIGVPLRVVYAVAWLLDVASRLLRRDPPLTVTGVRLMHVMSPADHAKATRELGWQPRPVAEAVRAAARFHRDAAGSAT